MIRRLQSRIQRHIANTSTSNGFTIVELLIVIAILTVITLIVFLMLDATRATERDTNRMHQTEEFMKAFAFYYDKNARYPDDGATSNRQPVPLKIIESQVVTSGYLSRIPPDPLFDTSNGYLYCSSDTGDSYALLVHMENANKTEYCVVSEGPDAYQNTLCSTIGSLEKCAINF